nr:EOG090X09NT [Triops cancriformis]
MLKANSRQGWGGYDNRKEKRDEDLDPLVSAGGLDALMPSSPKSMQKWTNPPSGFSNSSMSQSVSTSVRDINGAVEKKSTTRFSDGTEEMVITQQLGDRSYIIKSRKRPGEAEHREECYQNLDPVVKGPVWSVQTLDWEKLPSFYASLSKYRLTMLVVCSAVSGYAMAPAPFDPVTLALCLTGTALTSGAANTINQFLEVPFDSQMTRTSQRVLVRGLLTPLHAVGYGVLSAITGLSILYYGVNGLCASLGAFTLLLYTSVYTPMKRTSIANTWVGSLVGAIPPIMGYVGCTGSIDTGALLLAGVLFAWQFPHFNALSWNLRPDYSRAGYRMMAVTDPGLCRRTTLRYSVGMIGLCTLAPYVGLTTWAFALDSLPVNAYLTLLGWKFYQHSDSKSSRKLFRASLLQLPVVLLLMLLHKKDWKSDDERDVVLEWAHKLKQQLL